MSSYKVLCVGHDVGLLGVRAAALACAGCCPTIVTPYWATMLLHREDFDAVLLCHTLAQAERHLLRFQIESLEQRKVPVIQIYSAIQKPEFRFACPAGEAEKLPSVVASALEGRRTAATA